VPEPAERPAADGFADASLAVVWHLRLGRNCEFSRGPARVVNTAAAADSGISRGGLPPPRPA